MEPNEQYDENVAAETPQAEEQLADPASAEVPQEGQEQQQQNTQPEWNGTEWQYKYKGRVFVPRNKEHILALMQKGHGFNSEYDRLKQERQQFEQTRSSYDKYAQLDQMLQEHPELQQKINNVVYEYRNGNQQTSTSKSGEVDPTVLEQRQILEQTRGLYEQLTAAQADKQLSDEINQLKQRYPQDWGTDNGDGNLERRILQHAYQHGFPSLEAAYRDYMWDSVQANAKADALRNNKKTRQEQFRSGKTGFGAPNSLPPNKNVDVTKMSYNQIVDAVVQGQLS